MPAPDRVSELWSPGSFHYAVPVSRADLLERVRANTRGFDRLKGRDRFGMVSWVQEDRIRIWHSTFWRSQPSRGALLFDARVEDTDGGRGTALTGRLRLNTAYVATTVWTMLYVAFALIIHFPLPLIGVLVLVTLIQLVGIAIFGRRDTRPVIDFVEKILAEPAAEPVE